MKFTLQIDEQKKLYKGGAGSIDDKELLFFDENDRCIETLTRPRLVSIAQDFIHIEGLQAVAPNKYKYVNWYLRPRDK